MARFQLEEKDIKLLNDLADIYERFHLPVNPDMIHIIKECSYYSCQHLLDKINEIKSSKT